MSFPAFQILLLAVLVLLVALPTCLAWRLLVRRNRPGWKAILLVVPGVNLAAVYMMAYAQPYLPGPKAPGRLPTALPNH